MSSLWIETVETIEREGTAKGRMFVEWVETTRDLTPVTEAELQTYLDSFNEEVWAPIVHEVLASFSERVVYAAFDHQMGDRPVEEATNDDMAQISFEAGKALLSLIVSYNADALTEMYEKEQDCE